MSASQAVIRWISEAGKTCVQVISVAGSIIAAGDTVITTLRAAFAAASNAKSDSAGVTAHTAQTDTGTSGATGTAHDRVLWSVLDENGKTHLYETPAPPSSIFLGDGETVDLTASGVPAFISALLATKTKAGAALASVQKGYRGFEN